MRPLPLPCPCNDLKVEKCLGSSDKWKSNSYKQRVEGLFLGAGVGNCGNAGQRAQNSTFAGRIGSGDLTEGKMTVLGNTGLYT